jgi:hypothetical protein
MLSTPDAHAWKTQSAASRLRPKCLLEAAFPPRIRISIALGEQLLDGPDDLVRLLGLELDVHRGRRLTRPPAVADGVNRNASAAAVATSPSAPGR